jgi:hypothetical protein
MITIFNIMIEIVAFKDNIYPEIEIKGVRIEEE